MSIFGELGNVTNVQESTGYVEGTSTGIQNIIMEAAEASYTFEASLYISDIIASQRVCEGASIESVLEGFAGTAIAKLKALWEKLWSKVKGWFNAVIKRVQLLFQSGSKLVDTFGKELREKSTVGFKYKGYKYDLDKGAKEADTLIAALETSYRDTFKIASDISRANSADVVANSWTASGSKELDTDEVIKTAAGKIEGAVSISEANEKIVKAYRGGEETAEEIENFGAASIDKMLDIVKSGKNEVAKLSRAKSDTDAKFKKVIETINKAATAFGKEQAKHGENDTDDKKAARNETSSKITTYFAKASSILQTVISGIMAVHGVKVSMYQEVVKSYQSTIKSFATFRPTKGVKESSTEDDDDYEEEDDDSLLESAARFL